MKIWNLEIPALTLFSRICYRKNPVFLKKNKRYTKNYTLHTHKIDFIHKN